jgi:uncharacterized protein
VDFEWDPEKANENERKHSVSFVEATEVFGDELSRTVSDPDHSVAEDRFLIFGQTAAGQNLVVAFTEREYRIRLISARPMTPQERKAYELG